MTDVFVEYIHAIQLSCYIYLKDAFLILCPLEPLLKSIQLSHKQVYKLYITLFV